MPDLQQISPTELRILLVDDEKDFVETLADSLTLSGFSVATAMSSAEALVQREKFQPDVALVDIRLGQDDGLDLVQQFQSIAPELICVMATAYSDTNSAVRAMQSGAYDYLSKPFHLEDLKNTIKKLVAL